MTRALHTEPRRPASRWALACLLLAVALPASASATTRMQAPGAASASGATDAAHVARVLRYWTPTRMREARPVGARGGAPTARVDIFDSSMPVASASYATVPDSTVPPFAVSGRIFFRRAGQVGACSGTAIDTPTRQLVLTAGHCVNTGPVEGRRSSIWSRYMQFVPAYNDGQAPFGAFAIRRGKAYALRPWVKQGNPNFDVGAFLVSRNAAGENLADAVGGGVSIALNVSRRQQFQTFGYPGRVTSLQQCDSPYTGSDRNTYRLPGKPTTRIRCRWNPGASGGGWLIDGGTAINGLISYGIRRDRIHTFGPYFARGNVGKLVAGL